MIKHKIKIAVSSCLLGEAVRYDGTDKYIDIIAKELASEYNLISLCPEMAIGMGVPRAPIHLVEKDNDIQVQGVDDASCNMTIPLTRYAEEVVKNNRDICGYIFKKNSPSCGTQNVKVLNINGEYELKGIGIYASEIMKSLPMLPFIDEEDFLNERLRLQFLTDVLEYSKNYFCRSDFSPTQ